MCKTLIHKRTGLLGCYPGIYSLPITKELRNMGRQPITIVNKRSSQGSCTSSMLENDSDTEYCIILNNVHDLYLASMIVGTRERLIEEL